MPLSKRKIAILLGLLAIGLSWQAATTASADEVQENSSTPSASLAASSESMSSQSVAPASSGVITTSQNSQPAENANADAQVETQTSDQTNKVQAPASAAANTYDSSNYGAKVPYTTYEAEDAQLANGASQQASDDVDSTAVEASNQKYVELPNEGSSVTFQVTKPANALNVRYTVPDGTTGQLDVQINGNSVATLDLNSASSWQYLVGDKEQDSASEGARARFRFDEAHTLLSNVQLQAGDKITLVKKKGDNVAYGIDFIELEEDQGPKAQPENSISITDKGAVANDGQDDSQALLAAIADAQSTGKNVYIPAGQFDIAQKFHVTASNMKISGAGIWHTNLHFTSDQVGGGGFEFDHNDDGLEISDFFTDSNLTSRYGEAANYKAIAGSLGKDSSIHDFWEQHFEAGMWIGDYDASNMHYTDGLTVKDSRIRNNLADGINFAQGTKNSTVQNSNIRGNGDDGLASWSSRDGASNASMDENNKYLNNTIELGWRAGGVGIFGGKGHEVANNLIKDNFAGAGVRISTVFPGYNFDNNDTGISVHDNLLWRTGTTSDLYNQERGAIDFQTANGDIKNVTIKDNKLLNSFGNSVNAINANFDLSAQGNGDIHLDNNTIDKDAQLANLVTSAQAPAQSQDSAPAADKQEDAPSQDPAPQADSSQPSTESNQPADQSQADNNQSSTESSQPADQAQADNSQPAESTQPTEPVPEADNNQSTETPSDQGSAANDNGQAQPNNEAPAQTEEIQPSAENQAAQGQDQSQSADKTSDQTPEVNPAPAADSPDNGSASAQTEPQAQATENTPAQSETPSVPDQSGQSNTEGQSQDGQAQASNEQDSSAQADQPTENQASSQPETPQGQTNAEPAQTVAPKVPEGNMSVESAAPEIPAAEQAHPQAGEQDQASTDPAAQSETAGPSPAPVAPQPDSAQTPGSVTPSQEQLAATEMPAEEAVLDSAANSDASQPSNQETDSADQNSIAKVQAPVADENQDDTPAASQAPSASQPDPTAQPAVDGVSQAPSSDKEAASDDADNQAANLPEQPTNFLTSNEDQASVAPETPVDQPSVDQADPSQLNSSEQGNANGNQTTPADQADPSVMVTTPVVGQAPENSSLASAIPDSFSDAAGSDNQAEDNQKSQGNISDPSDSAQSSNDTSNPSGLSDLPNSPAVPGKGSRPASNQNPSMNTDTSNKPDKKAQALPETGDSKADSLMIFLGLMIVTFVGSLNKHQED